MTAGVWVLGLLLWGLVITGAELAARRIAAAEQAEPAEAEPAGPVVWTDEQLDRLIAEIQRHPRGTDV